jgi:VacB/RNase II family 3'-5' exoribonuclease
VVAIAERKGSDRVIVCTLHPNDVGTGPRDGHKQEVKETDKFVKCKPTDARMPWILLKINDVTKKALNIPGPLDKFQLWPIQMVAWDEKASLPLGRLKGQCLGNAGDLEAEERHALIEHGLDVHDVDFDEGLLDEVDEVVKWAKADFEREAAKRMDLRRKRIFTIDPATARDLDDAIHVDDCGGQIEVGVHIADVGHFLKLGSQADQLAQERTTSVYLINRVLPMLPHALCNHLCSLNPNEPKLSFSAHFRLDKETGDLVEDGEFRPRFSKTAICSVCRMNYDEVQEVLDLGKGDDLEAHDIPVVYGDYSWPEIRDDLFLLYEVCGRVRRGRMEGGALKVEKTKMIFHTRESEDGTPTGYHLESHSASHWIIEELMLLANRCVAKFLAEDPRLHQVGVLRRHDPPDSSKALELEKKLRDNLGIEWRHGNANELHKSCQMIRKKYGPILGLCVDMMVMRAGMEQAKYFVYEDGENTHHFALNFQYYTHFTSPIRRYPDVMVHRVLDAILSYGEDGFQEREDAENQVEICNEKKLACRRCSEQIDRAIFCIYLRRMKSWFYTIGTVLSFHKDRNEGGIDAVTVYCSQLGKESKCCLCADGDLESMQLITGGPDDELIMPSKWEFKSRGALELRWPNPEDDRVVGRKQLLRTLSCIPVVIIPTNTVPIDYAMFFVSPSHKDYNTLMSRLSQEEQDGFEWIEPEEEGVEIIHDAHALGGGGD